MRAHYITVSAFASKEDAQKTREVLAKLLPEGALIGEKVIEPETEGGVFTKELVGLEAKLERQEDVREFSRKVFSKMDDYDRRKIAEKIADYVDDECNLYLRLSKSEAEAGNIVMESKDSIHLRFKLAAYPARRENALKAAKELVEDAVV